eukprot:6153252-Prymnesium_polylepis.1
MQVAAVATAGHAAAVVTASLVIHIAGLCYGLYEDAIKYTRDPAAGAALLAFVLDVCLWWLLLTNHKGIRTRRRSSPLEPSPLEPSLWCCRLLVVAFCLFPNFTAAYSFSMIKTTNDAASGNSKYSGAVRRGSRHNHLLCAL